MTIRATDFFSEEAYEAALAEQDAPYATEWDAVQERARNGGEGRPDQCWLLDDRDVWVRNPWFEGVPTRHPEDDGYEGDEEVPDPRPPYVAPAEADDDFPF